MNKTRFLIFIMLCSTGVNAQSITELKFPYHSGYTLNLKGTMTEVLKDGSKQIDSSFTFYYINKELDVKNESWANFQCTSVSGNQRNSYESPLLVNANGMCYRAPDKKPTKKNLVQAISLPLVEGKEWTTIVEGNSASCKCISVHTFITSTKGDIDCFCIQTIALLEKSKGYEYKMKVLEFYNQDIGKVAYNSYYYYEKPNGEVLNVMEVKEVVSDYGFKGKNE